MSSNSRYSGQDVSRCSLCKTAVASFHCDICHVDLCNDCLENHFSDNSKIHHVVPMGQSCIILKCQNHPAHICALHCSQCDLQICSQCVISKNHKEHCIVDFQENYKNKKEMLRRDIRELEKVINPTFQAALKNIPGYRRDASEHSKNLKKDIIRQKSVLQKEIDNIFKGMLSEVDKMNSEVETEITNQEKMIETQIEEIAKTLFDLKKVINSNDIIRIAQYKSDIKIEDFRKEKLELKIGFSKFEPQKITSETIIEQFGSMSPLTIKREKEGFPIKSEGVASFPSLLDKPNITTKIPTRYDSLFSLSCLNDKEFWVCGNDSFIMLYNLAIEEQLVKSVKTTTERPPASTTVTSRGNLVYADFESRSIYIVKQNEIQALITLQGWKPCGVCCASSDELLVIMDSDDQVQTRVIRYSGSDAIQSIQWDNQGSPLYPSRSTFKSLSENRNLDICVADEVVVVVSAAGRFRFRYPDSQSTTNKFYFCGITTDSQSKILTADYINGCIHILDQDGQFLSNIEKCGLCSPYVVCVDPRDNLLVAEYKNGTVKKIQYYK